MEGKISDGSGLISDDASPPGEDSVNEDGTRLGSADTLDRNANISNVVMATP